MFLHTMIPPEDRNFTIYSKIISDNCKNFIVHKVSDKYSFNVIVLQQGGKSCNSNS